MYLQEILEVVIGLVFLWLVISLATMSFQEWIADRVNLRANELEKAIAEMLGNQDLLQKFYDYPLIANLYTQPKKASKKPRLPSYIPANKFSATLFQLILQAGANNSPVQTMTGEIEKQMGSIESPEQQKLAKDDWDAILKTAGNASTSGLGTAALDSLKFQVEAFEEKYPELKPTISTLIPQMDTYYGQFSEDQRTVTGSTSDTDVTMRQFSLGVQALQKDSPNLSESVTAILKQAGGYTLRGEQAIATTRVNLEAWFNDAMDRLSGDYKIKAQTLAFIISFILALLFNVDSINAATSLWREPTLRQAIIAQVQSSTLPATSQGGSTTSLPESIPALETQLQALNIPFGWTTASFDTGGRQCSLLPFKAGEAWGIPSQDNHGLPICKKINNLPVDIYGWLVKILGMLMTSAAAAQGSPFWFDILKKMINIRGTSSSTADQQAVG